jgi:hypothetical protein
MAVTVDDRVFKLRVDLRWSPFLRGLSTHISRPIADCVSIAVTMSSLIASIGKALIYRVAMIPHDARGI